MSIILTKEELEAEKNEILKRYRALLRSISKLADSTDRKNIRKAFEIALEAHKNVRRKSGEPYIYHPISVAQICVTEIGLGPTAVICALLHDVVEDTEITLDFVKKNFGKKVEVIIDGLTKFANVIDQSRSMQAENFRKILLTLSHDVRVVLIKLADRLDNMRTLDSMPHHKQLKIASETQYIYAPVAHRLGLYNIKTELEDLSLKYTQPDVYESIDKKLKKTQAVRTRFINSFSAPIQRELDKSGLKYEFKSRSKSIYSIWNKMKNKKITFEEVYDLFAIRIIIDTEFEKEKAECWKVYSIVTDYYKPSPDRLRDWISTPKSNGYESLHTTVMSPSGKWVEVQVRTKRMDEIAEKGYAAHWKYKEKSGESNLDEWLRQIREILEKPEEDALDFISDFKLNLFTDEIYVFTPKGEVKTIPKDSTVIDFAFEIHSQVGVKCVGGKVNQKLVPLSHVLKSGDQVEILTSKKDNAKEDWLNFAVTAKAKSKIRESLKKKEKDIAAEGKLKLLKKLAQFHILPSDENIKFLYEYFKLKNEQELFYKISLNLIDLNELKAFKIHNGKIDVNHKETLTETQAIKKIASKAKDKAVKGELVIGDSLENIEYKLSKCCNPIPGDAIFGFITINDGIKIHRNNCPNATELMSNYAYRMIKAKWATDDIVSFIAEIKITGLDDMGIVNKITTIISNQMNVNMQSISFESMDGIFEGIIKVYIQDTSHLDNLFNKLQSIDGILNIERVEN
jgi:GTP diphosphokinase / guanosine-3',5'-bis(diphosphate) 3'-diphosphatase